jgi:regulator of protease activity HflC (stomatin/prohibitin superfamily)
MEIAIVLLVIAVIFITAIKVVPQQHAWVVERWASTTAR